MTRASDNIRNAKATCACCAKCGRKLSAKAPVWRERMVLVEFLRPWAVVPVCEHCVDAVARTVHQYMEHQRAHVVCCEACARIARLAARRQQRTEARGPRQCENESCGETFEPTRTDGRFCSSRCRQQAYRRRKGVTDDETGTAGPDIVSRNVASVTDDVTPTPSCLTTSRNAKGKPVRRLRSLVQETIEQHLPQDQFEILKAAEESERNIITRLVGNIARKRRGGAR